MTDAGKQERVERPVKRVVGFIGAAAAALLVVVQLVTGIFGKPLVDLWPDEEASRLRLLAYVASGRVYLTDEGGAKRTRVFSPPSGQRATELLWTADGRYLATLSSRREGETAVSARYYDTRTQSSGTWNCHSCVGAGFVGNTLAALGSGHRMVLRNFHLDREPTSKQVTFEGWRPRDPLVVRDGTSATPAWANVLGGTRDGLIVTVPDPRGVSVRGGPEWIYRLSLDGKTARLATTANQGLLSNVSLVNTSLRPDRRKIAARVGLATGACAGNDVVVIFDTVNKSLDPLRPPAPGTWAVRSLAWGTDGLLYAAMLAQTQTVEGCETTRPVRLYQHQADAWNVVDKTSRLLGGAMGPQKTLALIEGRGEGYAPAGTLFLVRDGERIKIAERVTKFQWAPRSSAVPNTR